MNPVPWLVHVPAHTPSTGSILLVVGKMLSESEMTDEAIVAELMCLMAGSDGEDLKPLTLIYAHSETPDPGRSQRARCFTVAQRIMADLPDLHRCLRVLVLHPSYWLRLSLYLNLPALSTEVWSRVEYVDVLEDLERLLDDYAIITSGLLPSFILEVDREMMVWTGRAPPGVEDEGSVPPADPSQPLMNLSDVYLSEATRAPERSEDELRSQV
mmetsp:Transcript_14274/g.29223  ORF Transcript_14274/g.29223 Transcript_14274/m.29223 type:complete len:213 (+) Transcript_14274:1149-1787(+)